MKDPQSLHGTLIKGQNKIDYPIMLAQQLMVLSLKAVQLLASPLTMHDPI